MSLTNKIYKKYVDVIFKPKSVYDAEFNLENEHKISEEPTSEEKQAFRAAMLDFCKVNGFSAKLEGAAIPSSPRQAAPKLELKITGEQ